MPVSRAKKTVPKKKPGKKTPAKKRAVVSKSAKAAPGRAKASGKLVAGPVSPKRLEVTYKGRVQGVGFRFSAEQVALACGVTGWVRNEHNGDVQLVAEGSEEKLLNLLEGIRKCQVGRHITREQIRWDASRNEFDDFKIEYHC